MQKDIFDKIIGFLQGASWAIVLVGALFIFKIFIPFGFFFSIFLTILYIIFTLFLLLLLDAFSVQKQKLQEMKQQTALLEKLLKK
jgi:hypothetical protein